MSDSLRNDDTLTTADIARRPTPRQARADGPQRGPVPVENRADRIAPDTETVQVPSTDRVDVKGGPTAVTPGNNSLTDAGPLFPDDELHNFRARWDQVQTSFVDEPRRAVEQADSLVASVVTRIAEQFSNERAKLEEQWSKGDNVNTEDLRQSLRRYRSFFDRLLSF
ncbi:MAG TPA: hypothetical protein VHU44_02060 [Acidobacteriaceae bacterium]|jgi:hypothetical protein|nr:hypothetical protein [Acidobacteriaceae bacterium]